MRRWPELVQEGFPGDPGGVKQTFRDCFRKGDLASGYDAILATGEKTVEEDGTVAYRWLWWPSEGGEGNLVLFRVRVQGTPPVLVEATINRASR
jgi:hypothetical protein